LWNQDDLAALRDMGRANGCVPGLTGLAQIKGRDELPIEVKARYDNEYAGKMGLWLDVKIVFVTAVKAVLASGHREGGVK
jgi:O-antigen biosynthesis protein WbqP